MYAQAEKSIPLWSTAAAIALTAYTVLKGHRDGATGRELAIELVIVFALAAVTFVLARRVRPTGRAAVTLAALGLVSVALFWLGLFSVVLAGGAALVALETRSAGRSRTATAALVVAAITVVLSVVVAIAS